MGVWERLFRRKPPARDLRAEIAASNENFLEAIDAVAKSGTPQDWKRLYHAMKGAKFVLPLRERVPAVPSHGAFTASEGQSVPILMTKDRNEINIVPVFTSVEAMQAWDASIPYWVAVDADAFFKMAAPLDTDIIVNWVGTRPVAPMGRITRNEIQLLAAGMLPSKPNADGAMTIDVPSGSTVVVAEPGAIPLSESCMAALLAFANATECVVGLYLAVLRYGGAESFGLALRLRSESDAATVIPAMGRVLQPHLTGRVSLDVTTTQSEIGRRIAELGKTLYLASATP